MLGGFLRWLRGFGRQAPTVPVSAPATEQRERRHGTIAGAPQTQLAPNAVFTPTRPRSGRRYLVGRENELQRILDAILDDGSHVVLYSERGRGKTSLSNMAIEALRRRNVIVARFACEAQTDFDALMRGLVRDLPTSLLASHSDTEASEGCAAVLPESRLRPSDIAAIPEHLSCPRLVFVVDEFDRVTDGETRTTLADTIKLLSDRGVPLALIVVGVSATLDQIIGQHPSIERNITAIHLPLLEDSDIGAMLRKGGALAGLDFGEIAIEVTTRVARGMPYMAQLLGLRLTQAAMARGDAQVSREDVQGAVKRLLRDASPAVLSAYAGLTSSGANTAMVGALQRIAGAEQDQWGRLAFTDHGSAVEIGGQTLSSALWHKLRDAKVLGSPDGDENFVQFLDRPLVYHVQLLAVWEMLSGSEMARQGASVPLRPIVATR